jgi:hypothetical protein
MGKQRPTFAKQQLERDKRMKQQAKREKRLERTAAPEEGPDTSVLEGQEELSAAELMKAVEVLYKLREDEQISLEEFEEQKASLLARLPID